MKAYYNENDTKAAAWLRELIKEGHIADGDVDERSILDVRPEDLKSYAQCHFFAGIGGWSYALRLAGVPDGVPVWTGSCPCQPFSAAGKQLGAADERHLWPVWFKLIQQRNPSVVFGEQVASKKALAWLDGVFCNLEGASYACAAADLCAPGVGAPHLRQRLFWMAYTENTNGRSEQQAQGTRVWRPGSSGSGYMGYTDLSGRGEHSGTVAMGAELVGTESTSGSFWDEFEAIPCADGRARRIKPGISPLAHGIPARVGRLRGYGNAIVPQVAAVFIEEALNCL